MKETKDDTNRWRNNTMFMDWKNQYSENDYTTESKLQTHAIPIKLPMVFFRELEQKISQFFINTKCLEQPKQSSERRMELEKSTYQTSDYTTKLQSLRQYDTGTKTEIQINGTKQKAQR